MNKLNIFHGEDEYQILKNSGLFAQAFDYHLGYYNEQNQAVDIKNKDVNNVKLRVYTYYDMLPFSHTVNTIAIYLPFNLYVKDKVVKIEINNKK